MNVLAEFNAQKEIFEKYLTAEIEKWDYPSPLCEGMKYALISGGKRYRPTLMLQSYCAFGGVVNDAVLSFALAIECLHTYSLVHDDLPCMDNDDFRRGKPTVHRAFNETTAVLVGDALLNLAYELVFSAIKKSEYNPNFVRAGEIFSARSGASGMIKGQILDLNFCGTYDGFMQVTRHKTADLLSASIVCGAIMAGAGENDIKNLNDFAYDFGTAFQIIDDILDKDKNELCTIMRFKDENGAKDMATTLMKNGISSLDKINRDLTFFKEFFAVAIKRVE